MYPDISDGIGLTGFSQNGSFVPFFLLGGNFIEANNVAAFSSLPDGYLAAGDKSVVQTNFFSPGDFDPAILTYAYKNGQPVTIESSSLSAGRLPAPIRSQDLSISSYFSPSLASIESRRHLLTIILTRFRPGKETLPFCGGDCLAAPTGYPSIPSTSKMYFPNAEDFTVTISEF
jgi:hypothetical protein